ncbi:MAG: single-stranded DNA-binding protein [Anaerolineae bacterium]
MYQKIVIAGHLGSDPEMRYTPSGTPVTNFSVATNRRWTDAEGQSREETTWFRVITWGRLAETCNQYLTKGRAVLVEGERLNANPWINREGQAAATLELTARVVRFLGGREERELTFGEEPEGPEEITEESLPF